LPFVVLEVVSARLAAVFGMTFLMCFIDYVKLSTLVQQRPSTLHL